MLAIQSMSCCFPKKLRYRNAVWHFIPNLGLSLTTCAAEEVTPGWGPTFAQSQRGAGCHCRGSLGAGTQGDNGDTPLPTDPLWDGLAPGFAFRRATLNSRQLSFTETSEKMDRAAGIPGGTRVCLPRLPTGQRAPRVCQQG